MTPNPKSLAISKHRPQALDSILRIIRYINPQEPDQIAAESLVARRRDNHKPIPLLPPTSSKTNVLNMHRLLS